MKEINEMGNSNLDSFEGTSLSESADFGEKAFGDDSGIKTFDTGTIKPSDPFRTDPQPSDPLPVDPIAPVKGDGGTADSKKKMMLIVCLAVVLAAGLICGLYFAFAGDKEQAESVAVEQVEAEQPKPAEPAAPVAQPAEKPAAPAKAQGSLDYGSWSGAWKNGKPSGMGTMRYTKQHLIDKRDPQQRVAEKGDYITGEFVDGKLVQGIWYDSSNNVKGSIMIGM